MLDTTLFTTLRYEARNRCETEVGELAVTDTAALRDDFEMLYAKTDVRNFLFANDMTQQSSSLWIGLHVNQWEWWTGEYVCT